jgi:crossover junction endodeoxyribonuclease RuvC
MRVVGLDLSLTATGMAIYTDGALSLLTLESPHTGGMERLDWIYSQVRELCRGAELVVVEGLSFGSNMPSAQERAGLWFMVARALWKAGIRRQSVAPTQLKKFVTGKGSAEKSLVLREVFRRWNIVAEEDNQADAAVLVRIGLVLTGVTAAETEPQREVITAILAGGKSKKPRTRKNARAADVNHRPEPITEESNAQSQNSILES